MVTVDQTHQRLLRRGCWCTADNHTGGLPSEGKFRMSIEVLAVSNEF